MAKDKATKDLETQRHVKRRVANILRLTESILDKDWDKLDQPDVDDLEEVKGKLEVLLARYRFV